jgi:hypothetical protein
MESECWVPVLILESGLGLRLVLELVLGQEPEEALPEGHQAAFQAFLEAAEASEEAEAAVQ